MTESVADAIFWMAVVCCGVAELRILRSPLASRHAPPVAADGAVPRPRRGVELVWTALPAVLLAVVLAVTWHRLHGLATLPVGIE
jgi:hypothetical protein